MKAEERNISQILTEQISYVIPPYQRPYSWEQENVTQLLSDLWEAFEANDREYFIGSLITIEYDKNEPYEVVDGQQRLTTLNIILARLRDQIEDYSVKADLDRRILPRNVFRGEGHTPRLLLRKRDQSFFRKHILESQPIAGIDADDLELPRRHLIENAASVDTFIQPLDQQQRRLFAEYILSNVYVVFVTAKSWQSAYRLFNVLNARGIPLSNADLIKNTLFGQLGTQSVSGVNYSSLSTTIRFPYQRQLLSCLWPARTRSLVQTGAEGKALQGCNLSADSGARPDKGRGFPAPSVAGRVLG